MAPLDGQGAKPTGNGIGNGPTGTGATGNGIGNGPIGNGGGGQPQLVNPVNGATGRQTQLVNGGGQNGPGGGQNGPGGQPPGGTQNLAAQNLAAGGNGKAGQRLVQPQLNPRNLNTGGLDYLYQAMDKRTTNPLTNPFAKRGNMKHDKILGQRDSVVKTLQGKQ